MDLLFLYSGRTAGAASSQSVFSGIGSAATPLWTLCPLFEGYSRIRMIPALEIEKNLGDES